MKLSIIAIRRIASLLIMILISHLAVAQIGAKDTTSASGIFGKADTLRAPIIPLPFVGSIDRSPSMLISDSSINFIDYRYLDDLLRMTSGIFIRELGAPGQLHGLTLQGVDSRDIAFMSDGILLNEPLT